MYSSFLTKFYVVLSAEAVTATLATQCFAYVSLQNSEVVTKKETEDTLAWLKI